MEPVQKSPYKYPSPIGNELSIQNPPVIEHFPFKCSYSMTGSVIPSGGLVIPTEQSESGEKECMPSRKDQPKFDDSFQVSI